MRWSGPGLAISLPSNHCPSPSSVTWFAHFMNWNVSTAGIPLSVRPMGRPLCSRATLNTSSAPMTVNAGGVRICAHAAMLKIIIVLASLALTLCASQKERSQARCLSCHGLSLALTCAYILSGDYMLDEVWSLMIIIRTVRDVYLCVGGTKLPLSV